ncbi:MAG: hypothetical protein QNK19_03165 [Xanthomonadales bacterium]|nr:hypothetical protein [Xanthomonadales bacterium]
MRPSLRITDRIITYRPARSAKPLSQQDNAWCRMGTVFQVML